MTAPLRADAERNRRRLLDAASELFSRRGLEVTLDDIARHAGVGVGTAYRRFPNKDALIEELMTERIDTLRAIAVELRTDWLNHASQRAIERLGAKRDGVLRNHMLMRDGRIRDTVVYSILDSEWPGVKRLLELRLNAA